jgi:hypothetical protein
VGESTDALVNEHEIGERRADIRRTRAELSQTIDALQERLDPEVLKERVSSAVREQTIGRGEQIMNDVQEQARVAGNGFVDAVRRNPVPALIALGGVGWYYLRSGRSDGHMDRTMTRPGGIGRDGSSMAGSVGGMGTELRERVTGTTDEVTERVSEIGGRLGDRVSGMADDTMESIRGVGTIVRQRTEAVDRDWIQERPLAVSAAALGFGLMIGLMAPPTRRER